MKFLKTTTGIAIITVLFFTGISIGTAPFTPEGQKWEPPPVGHRAGKDNGAVNGSLGMQSGHFQGVDCGICHSPGKKAGNYVFTVSGTVFKDKLGIEALSGAEVILRDVENNVISMTTNEAGNFFTYAPVAYDPAVGGDPDTPRNWRYKAWVKYGDSVRPMVTLAYVGAMAHYIPRMSCNMHHGRLGTRGAVSAGEFETLPGFSTAGVSFRKEVMPILKNRCKACHMPESTSPYTTYASERFDYSGGLDLSAYAKDPGSAKGVLDTVNMDNPDESLLLVKPLEGYLHAGGSFWVMGNAEYQAIRQWIAEGAAEN